MRKRKNILIISFSDISSDARVLRQVKLLSKYYSVDTLSIGESGIDNVGFYKIEFEFETPQNLFHPGKVGKFIYRFVNLLLGRFEEYIKNKFTVDPQFFEDLRKKRYDLIVVNDLIALPFAFKIRGKAKIYFDAHEYYPREFEDVLIWRLLFSRHIDRLCRLYLPKVDAMTTVCKGIAEEYERNYGVNPEIVMNAAPYKILEPSQVSEPIKMVHHGGAIPSRRIELMIEMMRYLDDKFILDLYLIPTNRGYYERLEKASKKTPRVRILQHVPYEKIIGILNSYDIGVYILPPISFNNLYSLPNKFFEFIQARLCLAIGPSPEMARIVRRYKLGVIGDDFSPRSLAEKIKSLSPEDIMYYKRQSHRWARQFSTEEENKKIIRITKGLIGE